MPLVKPDLDFVFGLKAQLGEMVVIGESPEGLRRMIPIVAGTFDGPKVRGEVLGGGADWQYVRGDSVTIAEAVYLLKTNDGTLIQIRNRGVRHGPPEVIQRLAEGEHVDPSEYYFRASPTFLVSPGPHDWLNKNVFVCTGARYAREIELWFYRVT
jgi:Protein of unknown function (DUF3237)